MPVVTEQHMVLLRTLLTADSDAARDRGETADDRIVSPDRGAASTGFVLLLLGLFHEAVDRLFSGGPSNADTIRLVARIRVHHPGGVDRLDPATAERFVRGVLGDPKAVNGMDGIRLGETAVEVARGLVRVAVSDGIRLEDLLTAARTRAEHLGTLPASDAALLHARTHGGSVDAAALDTLVAEIRARGVRTSD